MALHLPILHTDANLRPREINSPMDPEPDFVTLAFLGWSPNIFNEISIYPAVNSDHTSGQLFLPHPTFEPFIADVLPTFFTEEMFNMSVEVGHLHGLGMGRSQHGVSRHSHHGL